jgi:predicted metal-binding membrane protein
MMLTSPWVAAGVLVAAGVYQFTPLKDACLGQCRSPLAFLLNRWRAASAGALRMGLEHGAFCTGCCWLLMAILFVVGVMNVAWIVALTLYVLIEKIAPPNRWLARATGAVLIGWGVWVALAAA